MRIEQRLKQLAEGNPNYSLLWAQWEFDKKLLSRALNTVSRDFLITVYMTHHIHPQ